MARPEKEAAVSAMQAKMAAAQSIVVADFRGLTVAEATKLRKTLREKGIELKVAKNTLSLIAARNLGISGLEAILKGPVALAFGVTDPAAPAKVLTEFAATSKKLEVRGAVVQGKVVGLDAVKALASLPSRDVLVAMVLGTMKAPITGIATVLDAVRKQKEGLTA